MSSTNCLRPRRGFCLNLRVRIVNSDIALARKPRGALENEAAWGARGAG